MPELHYKHISILIVALAIVAAFLWDLLVVLVDGNRDTWCQAVREINQASNGLLMWVAIGVGIHIFCVQWFPAAWCCR